MKIPSENELDRIRREYPVGTIIEIQKMDDPQAPPVGTLGEVVMAIVNIGVAEKKPPIIFLKDFVLRKGANPSGIQRYTQS